MTLALERGLALLERLAGQPEGVALSALADELDLPYGACHRLLQALQRQGYVRQPRAQGPYLATTRIASLGLAVLSGTGLVEIAEPILERLAERSGELVRLSVVDEDRLIWISRAQGARRGVRYDPDQGMEARLSCTSSGHAWLMTLSDEQALALVSAQGFGAPKDYGPKAPTTVVALLETLRLARERGYAAIDEVFAPGMAALAAPVLRQGRARAVLSIAGPRTRLDAARIAELAPVLVAAAAELGPLSHVSTLYGRPPLGKA